MQAGLSASGSDKASGCNCELVATLRAELWSSFVRRLAIRAAWSLLGCLFRIDERFVGIDEATLIPTLDFAENAPDLQGPLELTEIEMEKDSGISRLAFHEQAFAFHIREVITIQLIAREFFELLDRL